MSTISENTDGVDEVAGPAIEFDPGTRLEVKRISKIRIPSTGEWEVSDSDELRPKDTHARYAKYAQYAFIVRRRVVQTRESLDATTKILIQSDCLRKVLKHVLKHVQKLSWNAPLFKIDPQLLITFFPQLREYQEDLRLESHSADRDKTAEHLSFLINFLKEEHTATLQKIDNFISHNEITFDLLWAIFIPHQIIFTSCKTTSEPRAVRLQTISLRKDFMTNAPSWRLRCEYIDANDDLAFLGQRYGLATMELEIPHFDGVVKITELAAYPMKWHPDLKDVQEKLIKRGCKWLELTGVHHMHYNGVAYQKHLEEGTHNKKVKLNGRIMIDRCTFANAERPRTSARSSLLDDMLDIDDLNAPKPNHRVPMQGHVQEDDMLLASPILYGFSLAEKLWLEFNVEHVSPIEWNDEGFKNIAIDPDRKLLVQSLVESHAQDQPFDDFVQGKGLGLVINLFGPPGVGKTLTVEATSEHLHKPLYVVSAGELGTDPSTLDKALAKIFALVPIWGAVVLIDEADVYLEERSAADVGRNAMVAVFLRQIEYFCGILFLTTNRVKTFDQAFQSRIHLSLHYDNLSRDAREQLWKAFLEKARGNPLGLQHPTPAEVRQLSEKALNGRQIKMVVKLAITLANHKTEKLSFKHLAHTMDIHIDNPGFHQRIPDSPNRGERWWWWWVNLFRGGPIEERPYPY